MENFNKTRIVLIARIIMPIVWLITILVIPPWT